MPRHSAMRTLLSRPAFWIGAVLVLGAILIVELVVFANTDGVRRRIAMRRIWLNHGLRHYYPILPDILALKPDMLKDPQWQHYALGTFRECGAWRELTATALEMERTETADPAWRWHGFEALLILGRDSTAMRVLRPRLNRDDLKNAPRCAPLLLDAMDARRDGKIVEEENLLSQAEETAPPGTPESDLIRFLRVESLCAQGRWREADETNSLVLPALGRIPRGTLDQVPLLLAKGRAVDAFVQLEIYRARIGDIEPWVEEYLKRCLPHLSPPHNLWATEMLEAWRRERSSPDAIDDPTTSTYPPLPVGETILRLREAEKELPSPLLPREPAAFPLIVDEPGTHTLVVRGRADRVDGRGALVELGVSGIGQAYTLFPSSQRVDRRASVFLPAGRYDLFLSVASLGENRIEPRAHVDEFVVVRRRSPPDLAEIGFRDFQIQTGPADENQAR
ncbi:hypothetical protein JW916_06495 [Candidatus Sumerlaeota bacterium]|nr:hypothetical protein [Candidatus Sumerlaeota bacterium]